MPLKSIKNALDTLESDHNIENYFVVAQIKNDEGYTVYSHPSLDLTKLPFETKPAPAPAQGQHLQAALLCHWVIDSNGRRKWVCS